MKYDKNFRLDIKCYIDEQLQKLNVGDLVKLFEVRYEDENTNEMTVIYTLEYANSFLCVKRPVRYWEKWLLNGVYSIKPSVLTLLERVIEDTKEIRNSVRGY